MKNLYFERSDGEVREIKKNIPEEQVIAEIYTAVAKMNPKYNIYYVRHWNENGKTWYDVGSHVEFFFTEEAEI